MNLKQNFSGCTIAAESKWATYSAAAMGISFFLRMVYYFGLVNLRDVGGMELFFGLILPVLTALVFIAALKIPALRLNLVFLVLAAIVSIDYFFTTALSVSGVISGILQLAAAALFGAVCLGVVPQAQYLPLAGLAVLAFRVVFVDLFGLILPLNELALFQYVAQCANLFSMAALSLLYLCVQAVPAPAKA